MELERNVKIKWTDGIKNEEVFQKAKKERLLLTNFTKETPLMERAYS